MANEVSNWLVEKVRNAATEPETVFLSGADRDKHRATVGKC